MLQPPSNHPVANKSSLAFGIKVNGRQGHVSLIYRSDDYSPWLLHLCNHNDFRHEKWDESFHWIDFTGIPDEVEETFADWILLVTGNVDINQIPYSTILSTERNFANNGIFINRNNGSGLTCATFLLAMFADYGLALVNQESWPRGRLADVRWAKKFLAMMQEKFPGNHFLIQIQNAFMIKRFRPEEVVVTAGLYKGVQLKFNEVEAGAKVCLKVISS